MPQDPSAWTKVPQHVLDTAQHNLEDRPGEWCISSYLAAALNMLASDPDKALTAVGPYRIANRRGKRKEPSAQPGPQH